MDIGLISDSHGIISPQVFKHFEHVKYIFHAGDIGQWDIIAELEKIAPVIAVNGNIDNWHIKKNIPSISFTPVESRIICLVHDIGNIKKFSFELFKIDKKVDIVIHGHTHRPSYETYQNIVFVNPGSCTFSGSRKNGTIAILSLNKKEISHRFIEL